MIRKRHKWQKSSGLPDECIYCGCTRDVISTFGVRRHFSLKTYVRTDLVRFTGTSPECDSSMRSPFNLSQYLKDRRRQTERVRVDRMISHHFAYSYYPDEI
jgi:hypothetical protein